MSPGEIFRVLLLGYPTPPEMIDPRYPAFLQQIGGLCLSLVITGVSLTLGAPLGVLLAVCRSRPRGRHVLRRLIDLLATAVVHTTRGIPVMILVLLFFYLPYRLFALRVPVPGVVLAITAFTLYAAVYLSEIIRSGMAAVDTGWLDAARALGLSRRHILLTIKLPIALRAMAPAILGQAITVFKDTSVLTVVAVAELTYSARQIHTSEPANYALVLSAVLLLYWAPASAASALAHRLDKAWRTEAAGQRNSA